MAITVPPNVPFPNPILFRPSLEADQPPEGERRQFAALEIDWFLSGVAQACQAIDFAGRTTQPFTRIIMLDVDNTQAICDVQFIFIDTQTSLIVPAGTSGRFPVKTNGIRFFAAALQTPTALDKTYVTALNYSSDPVDIPKGVYTNVVANVSATLTASGNTAILAAGTVGVLDGLNIFAGAVAGAGTGNAAVFISDAAGVGVLWEGQIQLGSGQSFNGAMIDQPGLNIRFTNGLRINVATGGTAFVAGNVIANVYYRQN